MTERVADRKETMTELRDHRYPCEHLLAPADLLPEDAPDGCHAVFKCDEYGCPGGRVTESRDLTDEQRQILAELIGTFEWVLDRLDWGWLDYLYPAKQDLPLPWVIGIGIGEMGSYPNSPQRSKDEAKLLEMIATLYAALGRDQ